MSWIKKFFSKVQPINKYVEIDWDKVQSIDDIKALLKLRMYSIDVNNERVKEEVKKLLK
jgi:hypothetical protein